MGAFGFCWFDMVFTVFIVVVGSDLLGDVGLHLLEGIIVWEIRFFLYFVGVLSWCSV